ncbi:MAG: RNA polymerase sigma factor [Leptospiraceae bacterium]|nr:RNA polymerase sigma factor [Leptospiraceae bacterium]MDW7975605.1 RNA polymerase sigma factor [Leptospiraceae bacterium]
MLNKDKENLTKIIKENYSMVYNLGLRLFKTRKEEVEDFVQDVFLKFFENYHKFDGKSKISTWLYSLALNLGLNKIKKQKQIQKWLEYDSYSDQNLLESQLMETSDLEQEIEKNELQSLIQKELMELPDAYRIPLILSYYERLSYKEISEKIEIPEGTIKSLVYRGKLILRNKLKDIISRKEKSNA